MSSYLPVIPILECSRRNDLILDVFGGSVTVGLCAAKLDRAAVQFDIDPVNVKHALGEYADWYAKAHGCDPVLENGNGTTLINITPNPGNSKKAA